MTYKSLMKKIYNLFEKQILKKYLLKDNIYFKKGEKEIRDVKTILFYFPFYEFMHFGDHFFFEPCLKLLENEGYKVEILPIKKMESYFEKLNYKIGNTQNLEKYDLIITRPEFFSKVKKMRNSIIFIDIGYPLIKEPICIDISKKILGVLGISNINEEVKPQFPHFNENLEEFNIDKNKKYIIYNNYIDSGSFRVNKKKLDKLDKFVKNFAQENGLGIIHMGTENDKKKDNRRYQFVEIDLRGKTTVEELFSICYNNNIVGYVGFDNFFMHIFFILNKKNFILFRGRFLSVNREFIIKYVNPPFFYKNNVKSIIEYIK